MAEDFLSQDEVDALLKGATGESDEVQEEEDRGGVRPYNLATQERIVRGRMPTYEIINERFARFFRIGLFNFMRRTVDIAVGPVKVIKFSEFVRNLVVPTNLNMVHMKPLRGTALFVFDPNLIFLIVDNLFGGDGRYHTRVEGRDFTQTEQRIIHRLLEVVFEDYEKSWKSVYPVKFEYIRSEVNPQFATIATPNEVVVTVTFDIDMGNQGGEFHVCIPYSMIEPIRDTLYSALQGDHLEVDKRWIKLLSQQVQGAEVELVANLGQTKVTFEQILSMQTGDIIPLEIPKSITAHIDGVPVMDCRYGTMNGRYALRVNNMIAPSESE
ncbi:MAG: flagellar motor switch protein FliM [Nitrosomonas sp.]|uniref:flagellar motor switch protein FliM n=1 Tax=unclassified Nitrosomonas TaxID=2609265 RepID=UPI000A0D077D|nr:MULTISPECIES: flagellar motor switch protein FliM [unclassified Nitrosomonas]OQW85209.1 MAG: flagellar motor switch protein FliM [Proteobacteria bacterium ST_bin16]MBX9916236.1 flagellar motor switch protein FliM [Nitrosomonas sp.]MCG7757701.1 flagellar motor switch protein FliM [Nitrosomonas sp.]MDV6340504.1 flagellar motor switch protein FliM [Nitrosomonas sp. Is24]MDV6346260.1 flagellar motor switch protein FliM [Nitrosomonas sp. Is35]